MKSVNVKNLHLFCEQRTVSINKQILKMKEELREDVMQDCRKEAEWNELKIRGSEKSGDGAADICPLIIE